ncbi:MAG: FHA domain-containing protein [Lacunisphaera sp.]
MDEPQLQAWLELPDGRLLWLDRTPCTLGRGTRNTHVLDHPGVSRNHAVVQPASTGGYLIADLRSTNGTHVNGVRIELPTPLRDGDRFELGHLVLTYRSRHPEEQTANTGVTSVLIHSGPCWLLMLDLISFTAYTQRVGAEAAAAAFKHWLQLIRPILLRANCTIKDYVGDAVFAYWRQDRHSAGTVATAVRELAALRPASPYPFRILLHYGEVRISGGLEGESLVGPDVIFLFRSEKSTKPLGSTCVLSEAAAVSLDLVGAARDLGQHSVADYQGLYRFYDLSP